MILCQAQRVKHIVFDKAVCTCGSSSDLGLVKVPAAHHLQSVPQRYHAWIGGCELLLTGSDLKDSVMGMPERKLDWHSRG